MSAIPPDLTAVVTTAMARRPSGPEEVLAATLAWMTTHPVETASLLPGVVGAGLRAAAEGIRLEIGTDRSHAQNELWVASRLDQVAAVLAGPDDRKPVRVCAHGSSPRLLSHLYWRFNTEIPEDRALAANLDLERRTAREALGSSDG